MHQIVPLQVGQLRETLVANLTHERTCERKKSLVPHESFQSNPLRLTVAGVGLGVLPHRAVTRELLAADLALELVLGQMLGAM